MHVSLYLENLLYFFKSKRSNLRDELDILLKRAQLFANDGRIHALQDLQRLVLRPIQSKHMVDGYLRPDHQAISSLNAFRDFGLTSIPGSDMSLVDIMTPIPQDKIPNLNLGSDSILPTCWSKTSLVDVLGLIGEGRGAGPWKQDSHHSATWWYPLNVCWVESGNHSIMQGILSAKGALKPTDGYDLSDLYQYIKFDGQDWISLQNGQKVGRPLYPAFGQVYEIGRLLIRDQPQPF